MNQENTFNTGETESELRAMYNPDGSKLRKLQMRMLEMLLYIDSVCKQHGIEWRLDGGNILGAVRHGGFIPWDDDVDIVLLPKEFKKLVRVLKQQSHPQFVLQDHSTDPGFLAPNWAVLRDLKSEYLVDSPVHKARKYRGAQVDIFCYNNHLNRFLYRCAAKFSDWNINYFIGRKTFFAKIIYAVQTKVFIPLCKIVGYPFSSAKKYGHNYGHQACPFHLKWVSSDMIFPHKPIMFEGHEFPGPGNVEAFLKYKYGDYMKLPPKDKRNHHQADYEIWD